MTLHEPCWHEYLLEALDNEEVVIGSHISSLPLLENLTLDFNAQNDEMSYSSIQNHFYWKGPNAFPALKTITFLNAVNFDEEYYVIPFFEEPAMESFSTSGYELWTGFTLALSDNSFPSLQHWKLQVEADWFERTYETYAMLKRVVHYGKRKYSCDFITDEQGETFLDCVPSTPPSASEE